MLLSLPHVYLLRLIDLMASVVQRMLSLIS